MAEPTDASGAKDRENRAEYIFKKYVRWAIFFAAAAFDSVFLLGAVETICYQDWVLKLAKEHFAAIVGLPFAALAYLCLVILLEITTGTIEVKGLGFEFKGAGGPLVMWVISFLSIATAIKMLW
nr:hypothetical protein [uncultured Lichenicoccus sp.]